MEILTLNARINGNFLLPKCKNIEIKLRCPGFSQREERLQMAPVSLPLLQILLPHSNNI